MKEREGKDTTDLRNIAREVHVIKGTQVRLAKAVETNTKVFVDALQMTDAHIHVIQRVVNDVAKGTVYKRDDGSVDFAEYLSEYFGAMGFVDFINAIKEQPIEVQEAFPEGAVIFGG